jgi:hypothetical protein
MKSLVPPFDAWLTDVDAEPLYAEGTPTDIARANQWSFSLPTATRRTLVAADVVAFIDGVAAAFARKAATEADPWSIYVWYDAQACSLRLSVKRGAPEEPLPFAGPIERAADLTAICRDFTEGSDVLSFDELTHDLDAESQTPPATVVFVRALVPVAP